MAPVKICVCEDEDLYQRSLRLWFADEFDLAFVSEGKALLDCVSQHAPDLILLDLCLEREDAGFAILTKLKVAWPHIPVIIHSGLADYQSVVRAMQLGATDYIPKGSPNDQIKSQLKQLAWQSRRACERLGQETVQEMVGQSPAMLRLYDTVRRIKRFPGNVVIAGESGAGKELVARALRQADAPFVAVDCSTIAESTAESVLFGHERGAFTGAERARRGLLEEADGGTLYFDEIANMNLDVQGKLLRALQEKEITPLGGARSKRLSFRVICATNRDLERMCHNGEFRHDLYARLNVFTLHIPPLRERQSDIPVLLDYFFAQHNDGVAPLCTPQARSQLCFYDWPGNVRELSNTTQYLLAMSDGATIDVAHLPPKIAAAQGVTDLCAKAGGSFQERMRSFERTMLSREYELCDGNVSRMSRQLNIDRSNLHQKLIEYDIHVVRRSSSG